MGLLSKLSVVAVVAMAGQALGLNLKAPALSPKLIETVNNAGVSWTAGKNFYFMGKTVADAKRLCGVKRSDSVQLAVRQVRPAAAIPVSFDSRQQWGSICPSTSEIRDQSDCGSCWAFGAVESQTDRVCIASQGANTAHLSAEDMLSCCDSCGMGCDGGDPGAAMQYWVDSGVVDGGNYGGTGCAPYTLPMCDHHVNGTLGPCPSQEYPTPACPAPTCNNSETWANAKHFASQAYQVPSDVPSIQTEIMTYGPVEVAFTVYQDFLTYRSGVYTHTTGEELGGHAVKMLGWGVWTDGTPYWIIANSWNTEWGNKGYFLIARGTDECGIEDYVVAGTPK